VHIFSEGLNIRSLPNTRPLWIYVHANFPLTCPPRPLLSQRITQNSVSHSRLIADAGERPHCAPHVCSYTLVPPVHMPHAARASQRCQSATLVAAVQKATAVDRLLHGNHPCVLRDDAQVMQHRCSVRSSLLMSRVSLAARGSPPPCMREEQGAGEERDAGALRDDLTST
jgi:hypothetical protein